MSGLKPIKIGAATLRALDARVKEINAEVTKQVRDSNEDLKKGIATIMAEYEREGVDSMEIARKQVLPLDVSALIKKHSSVELNQDANFYRDIERDVNYMNPQL